MLPRDGHVAVLVGEGQPALVHHVGVARPSVQAHLVAWLERDGVLVVDVRRARVGVDEALELARLARVLVPLLPVTHRPHLVACRHVREEGGAYPPVPAPVPEVSVLDLPLIVLDRLEPKVVAPHLVTRQAVL